MADFKKLNVGNGTWNIKDEEARNDINDINNVISNTIAPSITTLNANKASHTDLSNAIDALDYSDAAVTGQYVSEVSETDGVINVAREALPTKLSDFTDDILSGIYQKQITTATVGTSTYQVPSNTSTNICTMLIPKGYNIIRIGVSLPNSVIATDFMALFSETEGGSTVATGTTEHQYIGNPIGTRRSVIDFEYTGYFASDTTFYCNILHNNANSIELFSFARIISIPID